MPNLTPQPRRRNGQYAEKHFCEVCHRPVGDDYWSIISPGCPEAAQLDIDGLILCHRKDCPSAHYDDAIALMKEHRGILGFVTPRATKLEAAYLEALVHTGTCIEDAYLLKKPTREEMQKFIIESAPRALTALIYNKFIKPKK